MNQLANLPRRARWAVPAAALAAAGAVLAGSAISAAQAAPQLPSRTPEQLVAAVAALRALPPLSGTVAETVSLGLPVLPSTGDAASLPSMLSGSHTIKIWYSGPAHFRLAEPQSLSESDLIRNGNRAWLWDSADNTVTYLAVPAGATAPALPSVPLTPQQAASRVLAMAGPTTAVSADSNVTVAGQAAYQLVLAPKSSGSLVGQVRIAIDARNDVPLRVQVFGRGAVSPAIQIGFTAVSFTGPPAADFAFSPPAGAVVTPAGAVVTPAGSGSAGQAAGSAAGAGASLRVIGQGWLTVASLPESALSALAGTARTGGSGSVPYSHSSASAAPSGGSGIQGLAGDAGGILGALLNSAQHVSGAWGSGRLLRSGLISVLITSHGRLLIGAVTPSVLYRAATQTGQPFAGSQRRAARGAEPK
jgi:outer membrane lipoprotein-sorting protein